MSQNVLSARGRALSVTLLIVIVVAIIGVSRWQAKRDEAVKSSTQSQKIRGELAIVPAPVSAK